MYEASKDTAEEYAHKLGNNARDIGRISFAADPLRHSVVEVDGTLVAIRRPTLAGKKVDGRALLVEGERGVLTHPPPPAKSLAPPPARNNNHTYLLQQILN